ncbi:MAG: hypothetical protein IJT70_00715 [Clostridia bacterium]|nr:hypothetical protein [Clostridia bacterium]
MKQKKPNEISALLGYAGKYKALTFLGMFLSAVAMVMGMIPYVFIWLAARDLIAVTPNRTEATEIAKYGWWAFGFALLFSYLLYSRILGTYSGKRPSERHLSGVFLSEHARRRICPKKTLIFPKGSGFFDAKMIYILS